MPKPEISPAKAAYLAATHNPASRSVAALARRLAAMTDENNHTGAVVALARWHGDERLLKAARGVALIHDGLGHMPFEVITFRLWLLETILAGIRTKHGDAVAHEISASL